MPWDGTRLMVAGRRTARSRCSSPAAPTSRCSSPAGTRDGSLWFVSDRSGWWNLYRWTADGGVEPMVVMEAEIGVPQWVFGESRYDFLAGDRVVFAVQPRRASTTSRSAGADGSVARARRPVHVDRVGRGATAPSVVLVGASPTAEAAVVRVRVDGSRPARRSRCSRPPRDLGLPDGLRVGAGADRRSRPAGGAAAYGLFYPPTNPAFVGPPGELPPLLVMIHGGPTAAAIPALRLSVQYWTSRGFAVVDVNYRGSTGFGRAYRNLLARRVGRRRRRGLRGRGPLAGRRRAGSTRTALCIRGGSAGGFTTLAALATGDTFAAGASHYGVADLEALALETHKFESRYLDRLIGPYPERRDVYVERSPIHHLDGFDRPLIVLQGLEDEVVPPAQSEMIVAALRDRRVPVAYVAVRGRAARLPPGRQHPPRAGRRAVVLRPDPRLRAARRGGHRAGGHRPGRGQVAISAPRSVAKRPPAGSILPSGRVPDRRRCSCAGGPAGHPAQRRIHSSWPLIALELES